MTNQALHKSVLLKEVVENLNLHAEGVYVDGTFGRGGYSRELLKAGVKKLYGIDLDPEAVKVGRELEKEYPGRFVMVHGNFARMKKYLIEQGEGEVDGIMLDLGVSSPQLDEGHRGFSFQKEGPLDMRMNPSAGESAADLVNTLAEEDLANLIYKYGEEKRSRAIARKICEVRAETPFETTTDLAEVVRQVVRPDKRGIDPATRTFQGLRIAVNQELESLETFLKEFPKILKSKGRLVVVSFHSLEDRIVKHAFRDLTSQPSVNRYAPVAAEQKALEFKLITKKGIRPTEGEVKENPRARSSILRAIERISTEKGDAK